MDIIRSLMAGGELGASGVAWGAVELGDRVGRSKAPCECVFTAAATDYENFHMVKGVFSGPVTMLSMGSAKLWS